MVLTEIADIGKFYAITDSTGKIIKSGLSLNQIKKLGNDPKLMAKHGKLRAIEDPNIDRIFKRQAGVDYDSPSRKASSRFLTRKQAA
jgi:hypothetical protein